MNMAFVLLRVATFGGLLTCVHPAPAQNWMASSAPNEPWLGVASSADGCRLVAAANSGPIYTSTNLGDLWAASSAPESNWLSVASSADGTILVAAANSNTYPLYSGPIFLSTDAGSTWAATSAP